MYIYIIHIQEDDEVIDNAGYMAIAMGGFSALDFLGPQIW